MYPLLTALHGAAASAEEAAAHRELRQVAELVLPLVLGGAARPPHSPGSPRGVRSHRGAALRRIRAAAAARKIPGTNE